ncbi:MAG: TIGR02281 family clan AA aspartic protease [Nitrospinae bacterium]|nr:TIGR02281 family clan AA aspartic protease [Nitrospinota bacterium]
MKSNQSRSFSSKCEWNIVTVFSLITVLIFFLFSPIGEAGVYSYKDGNGKTHYTDDLSKIPLEYRESEKGVRKHKEARKDTSTLSIPASAPLTLPPTAGVPGRLTGGGAIEVPLIPAGNNYNVEVVLNGTVTAQLILDTGASSISLSKEVAEELGMHAANIAAKRTFQTANGSRASPIFALQTIQVGHAQSILLEASINDTYVNMDGLLGMNFLGDYRFEIDRSNNVLILKPLAEGEMEWGGKPGSWWKKRFDLYNESIRDYSRGAKQLHRNRDPRAVEYKNLAEYFKDVKMKLENHARVSGVPDKFR